MSPLRLSDFSNCMLFSYLHPNLKLPIVPFLVKFIANLFICPNWMPKRHPRVLLRIMSPIWSIIIFSCFHTPKIPRIPQFIFIFYFFQSWRFSSWFTFLLFLGAQLGCHLTYHLALATIMLPYMATVGICCSHIWAIGFTLALLS